MLTSTFVIVPLAVRLFSPNFPPITRGWHVSERDEPCTGPAEPERAPGGFGV